MGYSAEIRGTLGMDTNSFKQDLEGARNAVKKFGQDVQNEGAKTGDNAGAKLVDSLEHRLFGSRHIAGALSTALGLNLEKISEKIAEVIVGGTKKGMEEAIKIESEISKQLDVADDRRLTTAQKIAKVETEIAAKKREQDNLGRHSELVDVKRADGSVMFQKRVDVAGGGQNLTEDETNKQRQLTADILADQNKLNALKDGQKVKDEAFHERERTAFKASFSDEEEMVGLEEDAQKLRDIIIDKKATEAEKDAARVKLIEKEGALQAIQLKIGEKKVENVGKLLQARDTEQSKIKEFNESQMDEVSRLQAMQSELLEINKKIAAAKIDDAGTAELINQRTEKELRLAKELADFRKKEVKTEKKSNDEDKLGLDELAQLGPHQFRVSSDTASQAAQAREVLRLKQQAEDARKLGNSDQAEDLRTKSETIRGGLTSLKSSERGITPELQQALVPTNVILASIDKTLGNKFTNQ